MKKHLSRRIRGPHAGTYRLMHDPFVDWAYTIVLWVVLVAIFGGIGAWVYVRTDDQIAAAPEAVAATHAFDQAALAKVTSALDARASEQTSLKNGYAASQDPSILP